MDCVKHFLKASYRALKVHWTSFSKKTAESKRHDGKIHLLNILSTKKVHCANICFLQEDATFLQLIVLICNIDWSKSSWKRTDFDLQPSRKSICWLKNWNGFHFFQKWFKLSLRISETLNLILKTFKYCLANMSTLKIGAC